MILFYMCIVLSMHASCFYIDLKTTAKRRGFKQQYGVRVTRWSNWAGHPRWLFHSNIWYLSWDDWNSWAFFPHDYLGLLPVWLI